MLSIHTLSFGAAGTAGTTLNNDIAGLQLGTAAASSNAITFISGASAYTINGNTINIGLTSGTQTIQNLSASAQTFNTAFNLNGAAAQALATAAGSSATDAGTFAVGAQARSL